MKTKFCIFVGILIPALLLFAVDRAAFGQMYGGQKPSASKPSTSTGAAAAADANTSKPGTRLPDGTTVATPITEEEAKKKYPMPNGKPYPSGDANYTFSHKPGYIRSPYSSAIYDCSKVPKGGLVLDDRVNKVFAKP